MPELPESSETPIHRPALGPIRSQILLLNQQRYQAVTALEQVLHQHQSLSEADFDTATPQILKAREQAESSDIPLHIIEYIIISSSTDPTQAFNRLVRENPSRNNALILEDEELKLIKQQLDFDQRTSPDPFK